MVLKKLFGSAVIAGLLLGGVATAQAKDALTLQLKWVTQAQFAGYYVAKDKGFFRSQLSPDRCFVHLLTAVCP